MFNPKEDTGDAETALAFAGRACCPSVRSAIYIQITNKFQGDVKRNKEIGAINGTWGPFFRVSFDLIIHSYVKGKGKQGWSSVLAFDRKPSIDLNKNGELRFFFHQRKYSFVTNVDLNRWYNISIEQKGNNRKVSFKKSEVQFGPTVKISCL